MLDHTLKSDVTARRLEVMTETGRRRWFSKDDKARVVEETLVPGAVVSEIARRHGLSPQQVFTWRRQARRLPTPMADDPPFVPAVVDATVPAVAVGYERAKQSQGQAGCWGHRDRSRRRHYPGRPRRGRGDDCGHRPCAEGKPVIGPSGTVRVMVATKPVDFRKGMEGLAMLVREHMKADPFSGAVYVFRAKRADRIKLIFWDGTGLCLFAKRLEDGVFCWPKIEDGVMRLSAAELSALLEGLDWRRVHAARQTVVPTQAG
jgi:transposase